MTFIQSNFLSATTRLTLVAAWRERQKIGFAFFVGSGLKKKDSFNLSLLAISTTIRLLGLQMLCSYWLTAFVLTPRRSAREVIVIIPLASRASVRRSPTNAATPTRISF